MSDNQQALNKLESVWSYINWILAATNAHADAKDLISELKREFVITEDTDLSEAWEYAYKWRGVFHLVPPAYGRVDSE